MASGFKLHTATQKCSLHLGGDCRQTPFLVRQRPRATGPSLTRPAPPCDGGRRTAGGSLTQVANLVFKHIDDALRDCGALRD